MASDLADPGSASDDRSRACVDTDGDQRDRSNGAQSEDVMASYLGQSSGPRADVNGHSAAPNGAAKRQPLPAPPSSEPRICPRCGSGNTKFCYYNNYDPHQPRHWCKGCKRHWTVGGVLRNIPPGSGKRKARLASSCERRSALSCLADVAAFEAESLGRQRAHSETPAARKHSFGACARNQQNCSLKDQAPFVSAAQNTALRSALLPWLQHVKPCSESSANGQGINFQSRVQTGVAQGASLMQQVGPSQDPAAVSATENTLHPDLLARSKATSPSERGDNGAGAAGSSGRGGATGSPSGAPPQPVQTAALAQLLVAYMQQQAANQAATPAFPVESQPAYFLSGQQPPIHPSMVRGQPLWLGPPQMLAGPGVQQSGAQLAVLPNGTLAYVNAEGVAALDPRLLVTQSPDALHMPAWQQQGNQPGGRSGPDQAAPSTVLWDTSMGQQAQHLHSSRPPQAQQQLLPLLLHGLQVPQTGQIRHCLPDQQLSGDVAFTHYLQTILASRQTSAAAPQVPLQSAADGICGATAGLRSADGRVIVPDSSASRATPDLLPVGPAPSAEAGRIWLSAGKSERDQTARSATQRLSNQLLGGNLGGSQGSLKLDPAAVSEVSGSTGPSQASMAFKYAYDYGR